MNDDLLQIGNIVQSCVITPLHERHRATGALYTAHLTGNGNQKTASINKNCNLMILLKEVTF